MVWPEQAEFLAARIFMNRFALFPVLLALVLPHTSRAEKTFAERLGWQPKDVVVILHVDDVAMSHASNLGAIESVEKGVATSWSVMMPCAWVPEIAKYLSNTRTWTAACT